MRALEIYCHGIPAGVLEEHPGEEFVFSYYEDYLKNASMPAISLTLPKSQDVHKSRFLFPFFVNMLSEGHNRNVQARTLHIAIDDDFGLLAATANLDTPGAVTVKPLSHA